MGSAEFDIGASDRCHPDLVKRTGQKCCKGGNKRNKSQSCHTYSRPDHVLLGDKHFKKPFRKTGFKNLAVGGIFDVSVQTDYILVLSTNSAQCFTISFSGCDLITLYI